jgi:hypothetical protein
MPKHTKKIRRPQPRPLTIDQLREVPSVDLMSAALVLGIGRTKAYEMARRQAFPCKVIRIGESYCIPTPGLLNLLGAD